MEPIWWMIVWFTPILATIGIVDAVRTKAAVWTAAGRSRLVWIALNLVPIIGAVVYLLWINPALAEAEEALDGTSLSPPT